MLVTFRSEAHVDLTMFSEIAQRLLRMMGCNAAPSGKILADDVPTALQRLKKGISVENLEPSVSPSDDQDEEADGQDVSLAHRAFPLIEMLEAAIKEEADVIWKTD